MKKDNTKWIGLFFLNTGIGILFSYLLKIFFSNTDGALPFIALTLILLLAGLSSIIIFFLSEKSLSTNICKIIFLVALGLIFTLSFILNKNPDIKTLFVTLFIFVPICFLLLLLYKIENKEFRIWYYISFIGIPLGIIFYIIIVFLFSIFISFLISFILIGFSGWFILWRKNWYIITGITVLTFILILFNYNKTDEKFYGKIYIKDIKENIFSKEEVGVKGIFLNDKYYSFYFNNEKVINFKNSIYELLYNRIIENPSILIFNGGGGVDVSAAIYFNAKKIDVTENNPEVIDLLKDKFSSYTGGIYHHRSVMYYRSELLPFTLSRDRKYNIIQINDSQHLLSKPFINFSIENIENYKNLLEKDGVIYFIFRKWDKYNIIAIINTISIYLKKSRKTLYETVRIININTDYILIFKPEGFTQDLGRITEFCSQNSYTILNIDQFLDKKELKEFPYIEKNRIFPYSLNLYDFKKDTLHLNLSLVTILIIMILLFIFSYIISKKKKNLKNVYVSNLLVHLILSSLAIGLFISPLVYYIWALFEDTFLTISIILSGIFFFSLLISILISYKMKLNRTAIIFIHSLAIIFFILYFLLFNSIKNFAANFGLIKRIIIIILLLAPLFSTLFSSKIFTVRWWIKINEKTPYLNWSIIFLSISLGTLIGFLTSFFGNLGILWLSIILLELFSLLTFLKLDYFYKKNNYIYRRYGI